MCTPSFSIIRPRWTLMVFSTVPQIAGDLLVEPAGDNMGQDFAFPRRQGGDLGLDGRHFGAGFARSGVLLFGAGDGVQ